MITCYIPKIEDLWFKETMLADPDTMSYNHAWGGTISFPKEHGIRFLFTQPRCYNNINCFALKVKLNKKQRSLMLWQRNLI